MAPPEHAPQAPSPSHPASPDVPVTVTAALPYANGPMHIGHMAGVYIPADIYVRYLRARGKDVLFVCGSDEHGVAITMAARKEGSSPQAIVDKYHAINEKALADFKISTDVFSRTSRPKHHETALEFFEYFEQQGKLIKQESEQLYDPEANVFLADRYVTGTCPVCSHPHAYGDQCENCGTALSPTELINPKSTVSGATPELRKTTHWYFPLNDYQVWLQEYIDTHPDWKSNVLGQVNSWLKAEGGLRPRAITRDLDWGIPLPKDLPGAEGKVLYVWFDAPIGYITATKEVAEARGDAELWQKYWLLPEKRTAHKDAPAPQLIHFIGKDNIVFHTIIFPAMLHGHERYVVPHNVPANEFLNLESQKISTSRNWAVWAHEFAAEHPEQVDALRYVLTAIMPETKDADFSWEDFQARVNGELVAVFSNFVHRVLSLIQKYYDGEVPYPGTLQNVDEAAVQEALTTAAQIGPSLERYRFREGLATLLDLARVGNKYLAETEPWQVAKTDEGRVRAILYTALRIVHQLAIACRPFLPETSDKLLGMLALDAKEAENWESLETASTLPPGTQLPKPEMLFTKIDDDFVAAQQAKLRAAATSNAQDNTARMPEPNTPESPAEQPGAVPPLKAEIQFDDFMKLDLRVGLVLDCQPVPKADKLLQLTIDLGLEQRTILSGIAQHFSPEEVKGRRVVVVANLAGKKMRGILSQGMVLMSEEIGPDGQETLAFVDPGPLPPGSVVR